MDCSSPWADKFETAMEPGLDATAGTQPAGPGAGQRAVIWLRPGSALLVKVVNPPSPPKSPNNKAGLNPNISYRGPSLRLKKGDRRLRNAVVKTIGYSVILSPFPPEIPRGHGKVN